MKKTSSSKRKKTRYRLPSIKVIGVGPLADALRVTTKHVSRNLDLLSKPCRQRIQRRKITFFDATCFAEAAFDLIDEKLKAEHCPPSTMQVVVDDVFQRIEIHTPRIAHERVNGKMIFYGPNRPRVQIGEGHWIAGMSQHAVDRLFERCCSDRYSIESIQRVYHSVTKLAEFEPTTLNNGNPAFKLWLPIDGNQGMFTLGHLHPTVPMSNAMWLAAICPVVLNGQFAVAKSCLSPSFEYFPAGDPRRDHLNLMVQAEWDYDSMMKWLDATRELNELCPLIKCVGSRGEKWLGR
jgi:hypothetical protein